MARILWIVLMVYAFTVRGQSPSHVFTALYGYTYSGGIQRISLQLSNETLFGTVPGDGGTNQGSVFMLKTDGTGFIILHSFIGSDGAYPSGRMVLSGSTLYGTTRGGGAAGNGTVFKMGTDGSGFMSLYSFSALTGSSTNLNKDGAYPAGDLALLGEGLYGTASGGGAGYGTVFAINLDGTGFTNLHSFAERSQPNGVISSDNVLYGTFYGGGFASPVGGVFTIRTNGGFVILHSFSNRDGAYPSGGLTVSNQMLFGTTKSGGQWGDGTVFSIRTDGSGFQLLHEFTPREPGNDDGAYPQGSLALWNGTLYGATPSGGTSEHGVIFGVSLDGSSFKTIYTFSNVNPWEVAGPFDVAFGSGNKLYGAYYASGIPNFNALFSVAVTASLSIVPFGSNLILTWPLIPSGLSLQSSMRLLSPIWVPVSPGPVIVNGQNLVISPSSGQQQFFRLSQ